MAQYYPPRARPVDCYTYGCRYCYMNRCTAERVLLFSGVCDKSPEHDEKAELYFIIIEWILGSGKATA